MSNKILVHTINIDLPDKLLNRYKTKTGKLKETEIEPLTKTGNLRKVRNQLVVNLHTVKDLDEPRIYIDNDMNNYNLNYLKNESNAKSKKMEKEKENLKLDNSRKKIKIDDIYNNQNINNQNVNNQNVNNQNYNIDKQEIEK